jgi:hypothetical protein
MSKERIQLLLGRAERLDRLTTGKMYEHHSAHTRPGPDRTTWRLKDVYRFCRESDPAALSPGERVAYADFIAGCQDPENGLFVDRFGTSVYSHKALVVLKQLDGRSPRFPLGVCNDPSRIDDGVSETMGLPAFRAWMERVYRENDFYSAGSLFGHFIEPHCVNLRAAGRTPPESEYVREFRRWLHDMQEANGLWNRGGDPVWNGWNGLLKMYASLVQTDIPVPNASVAMRTILDSRNESRGHFGPGQCTNYNACFLLGHLSVDNDLMLADETVAAFEWYATCIEARHDSATGYFWENDIWPHEGEPTFVGLWSAYMTNACILNYCRHLLAPEKGIISKLEAIYSYAGACRVDS